LGAAGAAKAQSSRQIASLGILLPLYEMRVLSKHDLVAELDMQLSSAELQQTWDAERNLTRLPDVEFRVEGLRVALHFRSNRGSLPGIQEIKRAFAIAMGRPGAFPSCRIQWLT